MQSLLDKIKIFLGFKSSKKVTKKSTKPSTKKMTKQSTKVKKSKKYLRGGAQQQQQPQQSQVLLLGPSVAAAAAAAAGAGGGTAPQQPPEPAAAGAGRVLLELPRKEEVATFNKILVDAKKTLEVVQQKIRKKNIKDTNINNAYKKVVKFTINLNNAIKDTKTEIQMYNEIPQTANSTVKNSARQTYSSHLIKTKRLANKLIEEVATLEAATVAAEAANGNRNNTNGLTSGNTSGNTNDIKSGNNTITSSANFIKTVLAQTNFTSKTSFRINSPNNPFRKYIREFYKKKNVTINDDEIDTIVHNWQTFIANHPNPIDLFANKGIKIGLSPGANQIAVKYSVSYYISLLRYVLGEKITDQNKITKLYNMLSARKETKGSINILMSKVVDIVDS